MKITNPDNSRVEHFFGIAYNKNEGRILREKVYSPQSSLLRTTTYSYLPDSQIGLQDFADVYGSSLIPGFDPISTKIRPVVEQKINQVDWDFVTAHTDFDELARPKASVEKSLLLAAQKYSRTRTRTYQDYPSIWVLNLPKTIAIDAIEMEENTYYPASGRLWTKSVFGRPDRTYSWHANGSLASVQDAINPPTLLSNYKRGIPRSITLPTTATLSATVDDQGGITAVQDAMTYWTSYERDELGRIEKIDYPNQDSVDWLDTSITYEKINFAENGVAAGHWRRTEVTGPRKSETFYDALLRPILEVKSAIDTSITPRSAKRGFDHENRQIFASYPTGDLSDPLNVLELQRGMHTSYDALGRVTGTSQDSELSSEITTVTSYPDGFSTVYLDGRNLHTTTTTYQAFDAPTLDSPIQILAPEGQTTTFTRDAFGKPTSMKRSGGWSGSSCPGETGDRLCAKRTFVYDGHQRLCKTIEPDAGITVIDYDAASNVLWRALGQATRQSEIHCEREGASDTSWHYYDAMNRVLRIDHPAGTADVGYTYHADGAIQTATTGVLSGASWLSTASQWSYTYNKRRLLESEHLSLPLDSKSYVATWEYNDRGDRQKLTYPDPAISPFSIAFNPNPWGEPVSAGKLAAKAIYHPNGMMEGYRLGNDVIRRTTLNARKLPLRTWDTLDTAVIFDHTLTYDRNSNVEQITDAVVDPSTGTTESRSMIYDGRNRLTSVSLSPSGTEIYEYDPLDGVRRSVVGGVDRRFHYSAQHRLDTIKTPANVTINSYGWNNRGELTSRTLSGVPQAFTFDKTRRLTASPEGATHTYDAHNRRVKTVVNGVTRFQFYSIDGELLYVEESPANQKTHYVYLNGALIAERTGPLAGSPTVNYVSTDHRGSTSVKTVGTTVFERMRLMPYGEPYDAMQWRNGPGFTKHAMDPAGKLVYMQQRYYDPQMMQFVSPDPVEADAQSFSRYWYANNNPYRFFDPDGRESRIIEGREYESRAHPNPRSLVGNDLYVNAENVAECVELVKQAVGGGMSTSTWRAGSPVSADTPVGTAVGNFNSDGKFETKDTGQHAAILIEAPDAQGAIVVADQWKSMQDEGLKVQDRTIQVNLDQDATPSNNAAEFKVILFEKKE